MYDFIIISCFMQKFMIIYKKIKDRYIKKGEKTVENEDRIVKFLAYDGKVSIICANTTYLVEQSRKIHDFSPVVTAAFGRVITVASMMATNMKDLDNSLTIQIKGDGPIGNIVVSANCFPKLKGYVQNPTLDLPLNKEGKLDVSGAVGKTGFINVVKDLGLKEPYIGMVPIVSGEIAEDFTNYFGTSEQIPTVVALGVLVNNKGVSKSGGYILSLMPDATETEIKKIEDSIKDIEPISKMLDQNMSLEEIAKRVTGDENVRVIEENIIPVYECDCSKERFKNGLITIGKEELEKIVTEEEKIETVCHFCNKKYEFTKEELEEMVNNLKG